MATGSPEGFIAAIDRWVDESDDRLERVFKASAQDVFKHAQRPVAAGGNMPVDTGFLRSSLATGLNGGISVGPPLSHGYVLTIARSRLGDVVTGVWTAKYARIVEYGARGRPGRRFVGLAAASWQRIVARNARRARARAGV